MELLSPTGRADDLFEKRRIYAEGAADLYWMVDPDETGLTVLRLTGRACEERSRVVGTESYDTDVPFAVRVVPAELVAWAKPGGTLRGGGPVSPRPAGPAGVAAL